MAPEIIEGREADERSDIFSLGTILYWLALGRMPFAATNTTATLRRVLEGDYEEPRAASPMVSDELAALMSRALAVDPALRYESAAAMRDALDAVLLDAGLDDPPRELAAFLADPGGYRAAFPPRLARALGQRASDAMAKRQAARALKLWNRILAVDPTNQDVLRELARVERQARLRRAARRLVVAAAVATLVAGAAAAALRLGSAALAGRKAAAPEAAAALASPAGPPRDVETSPPASPLPAGSEDPARQPAPAARPASPAPVVSIHVRPYAQRALLDGVEVARGAQEVTVELPPGKAHRIQIEHACCSPFIREFAAGEDIPRLLELRAALQPRPALLRVEADPAARVSVAGRPVGTAGDSQRAPIPVPVPGGGESPYEAEAEVRIELPERPPYSTRARFRAGAELTVVAPKSEEPQ
jgi:serine/threonine-protein kinase